MSNSLSLRPDPNMRWIYDHKHPDYNSPRARDLRDRRDAALRGCPEWALLMAARNDTLREEQLKGKL